MRVAVVGAAHWHVPMYLPGLDATGARVTGVWDDAPGCAARLARQCRAETVTRAADLADPARSDLALVFGRPADMPGLAEPFIARSIPISMEKPGGLRLEDVTRLRRLAEQRRAHVSVAFVQRHAGPAKQMLELMDGAPATTVSARFIAGAPQRYREAGCAWMLDPRQSGGGALINLGIHFVDLARALTRSEPERLRCQTSNLLYGEAVEDHASLVMRMRSGAVATIEAGYGFPDSPAKRHFALTACGAGLYADFAGSELRVTRRAGGGEERRPVEADTDAFYAAYVRDLVAAVRAGAPPRAGLAELEAALAVVAAAYGDAAGDDR